MIRWNWNPDDKPLAFVDFETTSNANLREVGSHAYVRDASTRLLSAVWQVGSDVVTWVPRPAPGLTGALTGDAVPEAIRRLASTHTWVAHNAEGFDAMLWEALFPEVVPTWMDSMHLCRVAGLPASLDAASKALGGKGKDEAGSKIMKLLTSRPDAVGTVPLFTKLLHYNRIDVERLEEVWGHVAAGRMPRAELTLHSAVNERGVAVDRAFAESLHATWIAMKLDARDEIAIATGGKLTREKASSGPAVHAWLKSVGVNVKSLRRDYLQSILDDPDALGAGDDETAALVSHVLRLRADVVRAGEGKVARLVGTLDADDRLRRMFVYHGAATGRFSSRVVQVHNLPRGVDGVDVEELCREPLTPDRVRQAAGDKSPSDVLATLVRPCFVASPGRTLCIADFASIEARLLAWLAGQSDLTKIFAAGGDVYCDMASGLYNRPITKADKVERQVGKTTILGAGYGMGHVNFARVCTMNRIDLEAAGVTAEQCIKAYRSKYPNIPKLWRAYSDAAMNAIRSGGVMTAGRCTFAMRGLNLHVTLPSGRDIIYREARIANRVPRWAVLRGRDDIPPCDCIDYTHPHGFAKELYGPLLCENVDQAISRDLLVDAMLRYEASRPNELVLHVHDEIVAEAPASEAQEAIDTLCRIMSTEPTWAEGLGTEVEGFTGPRYVKSPFRDAYKAHYRGGVRCSK